MVKSSKSPNLRIVPDKTAKAPGVSPKSKAPPATNQADMEAFHYHLGVVIQAKAACEAPKKFLKAARRAAQDAGLVLKDLDTVIAMREEEPETVQNGIRRLAQYATWAGLAPGVQGDLFKHAPKVDEHELAEHEGYVDGLEGKTAEGERYDTTNSLGQSRLKGWHRGQGVIQDRFLRKSEDANAKAGDTPKEKDGEKVH